MNTVQIAEQVKEVIMREFFADVNDKRCVLDLCIENDGKTIQQLSKVSQSFYEQRKEELIKEYNSGRILFFRKYNYEKILNRYLEGKYSIDNIEFNMFPSEKKKRELEERHKQELREKEYREKEEKILSEISELKWKKTVRVSKILYKSVYKDGRPLELRYITAKKNKKTNCNNKLLYNNCPFSYVQYDVNQIVAIIEKTKPQNIKAPNIEAVNNKEKRKAYKPTKKNSLHRDEKIRQGLNISNQQIYIGRIQKISEDYKVDIESVLEVIRKIQQSCSYCKNGKCFRLTQKCAPYEKGCISYYRFLSKVLEKSKEQNMSTKTFKKVESTGNITNKENTKMSYEIGLKDFVVRGNVFKCMHNKHKIDNVVARINIDNDGKTQQIKISAGYCSQCKTYFILDSTYQGLKKKGMILCRVTDEKNYMKGSHINGTQLAQESMLMQYGYNVSQTEGLSATGRQKILAVIIDNRIMAKSEIISYLDFFINQRSSLNNMGIAISKWEADREFVENYKIGQYTQFGVNAIYRR